jgi:hypothetical protein
MAEENKKTKGMFAFGTVIFCLFFMMPIMFMSLFGYWLKNEQELKVKCIEQGKTYVNSMCLQITTPK